MKKSSNENHDADTVSDRFRRAQKDGRLGTNSVILQASIVIIHHNMQCNNVHMLSTSLYIAVARPLLQCQSMRGM